MNDAEVIKVFSGVRSNPEKYLRISISPKGAYIHLPDNQVHLSISRAMLSEFVDHKRLFFYNYDSQTSSLDPDFKCLVAMKKNRELAYISGTRADLSSNYIRCKNKEKGNEYVEGFDKEENKIDSIFFGVVSTKLYTIIFAADNRHKPALGVYKITSLTTACLQKFINSKTAERYSLNTLSVLRGILTGSLQYAVRQSMIKSNPAREVCIPTARSNETLQLRTAPHVYLRQDIINKIFERFPETHPSHIPLMLGYRCGLRLGEVFAITWDCVDLERGRIVINKQVQWNPKEQRWFFTNPKFNSFRTVDLDSDLLELLRRERQRQDKNRAYYEEFYMQYFENDARGIVLSPDDPSGMKPIELLLVRQDGSYIQARTLQHTSAVIHHEMEVKDFTFHSLRHTHATMLAEVGMPQIYTQQRLGHKDIAVTLKYYTHLTDKMSEIGGSILEGMFVDKKDI